MKKTEIVLGIILIAGIIQRWFYLPLGTPLTILSLLIFTVVYLFLTVAILNDIKLKDLFKGETFKDISNYQITNSVLTGVSLAIVNLGLYLMLIHSAGAKLMILLGLLGLSVILIIGLTKYLKNKTTYFSRLFIRIAIFGSIGLTLFLTPIIFWTEIQHSDHPAYVQAVREAYENPENKELWVKAHQEFKKIVAEHQK